MKRVTRSTILAAGIVSLVALAAGCASAGATTGTHAGARPHAATTQPLTRVHAVFAQTNNPAGNQIVAFQQAADGSLSDPHRYSTGGKGGHTIGKFSDTLASQSSVVYDPAHGLLLGVNAGSNTIYAFEVHGARLQLRQVIASGGEFPVSIAVRGDLVYVLNAGGAETVHGFTITGDRLNSIPDSTRTLGLANGDPPLNVTAPAQVGFARGGTKLVVVTKNGGNDMLVFGVTPDGRLANAPVRDATTTPMPFAFDTGPGGLIIVAEGKLSHVSTYVLRADGTVVRRATLGDGGQALCWITRARLGNVEYVTNNGTASVTAYEVGPSGRLSFLDGNAVAAKTHPGPSDMATLDNGSFLYVQGGTGTVDEFQVQPGGTLTSLGSVGGLGFGSEGLAAA